MFKKILLWIILMFSLSSNYVFVYAWVVPGTIQKWTNTQTFQCWITTTSYVTSNTCSSNITNCGTQYNTPVWCCTTLPVAYVAAIPTWCWVVCTGTGTPAWCWVACTTQAVSAVEAVPSWCSGTICSWNAYPYHNGHIYSETSTNYNNYISDTNNYNYHVWDTNLTNDTQTCTPTTTWVASSWGNWTWLSCSQWECWSSANGGGNLYSPLHGYCSQAVSVKTIISTFDQLWNRTYEHNDDKTTVNNTTRNTNLTATCEMQWRYATPDNTAPSATTNWLSNDVSNANANKRCNMLKYRWIWYTYKADENPGCEYYKWLNTFWNPTGTQDLLKWLEITIPYDPSWFSQIQIRLWKCFYTYTPNSTDLWTILTSSSTESGYVWNLKETYRNQFILKYNTTVSALWKTQPSLLTAFWKARLDECLDEWKNSLTVLVKDMARSTADGVTLTPNEQKVSWGTINIDNSVPKVAVSNDLATTSLNWWTLAGWFIGTVTDNLNIWRNYSLTGNIQQWEKYAWWTANECKNFTWALTGNCGPVSAWFMWVTPPWVNGTTGKFKQFTCDGDTFPSNSECQQIPTTCSNWQIIWWACINYCVADHTVNCIVKEWGTPAPVTPAPVTPGTPRNYCTLDGTLDCELEL